MGFVLLEDDQQCTLEAVLAFLDEDEELHHGTSSDSNSDYSPASPEREEVTTGVTAATTGWIQVPQRPVVSSEPKSSRATRDETMRTNQRSKAVARRQQIESILVRNEVHELEKVLRRLQRAHETRKRNSKWYRVALAQAQERYKSEALNHKLKNAVAKRLSASQLLQEAFAISATSEDLKLLSGNERLHLSCHRSVAITEEDAMHTAELQALVPKLYALCDVVLDRAVLACGDVRKTSWAAKVKHDPLSGPFMELKLQTRLPELAFHDFSDAIWESMINERTIGQPLKLLVKSRNVTSASYQKTYTLEVDSPFGPVNFNGVSFARRFVEPQRIVHVCSSVLTSPTDGQKFRERGWVAASPNVGSEDTTGSGTVVHFGYQIFSGSSGSSSLSLQRDHQATTTSNTILRALGDRPRIPIQQIQKMMRDLLVF